MNYMNYNLEDFQEDIYSFNRVAGNAEKVTQKDFVAQMKCLKEEVQELNDEIQAWNDPANLVKETLDVLYVAVGILQKLDTLGIDTSFAMQEIAENNLEKFPKRLDVAISSVIALEEQGHQVKHEYNAEYDCYTLRDSNGKVRKPLTYHSVDIHNCIPVGFKLP